MYTLTRAKVGVEMLSLQLVLAAFRHPHCFGRPAIIQYVFYDGPLDEINCAEIIQGKKAIRLWGSALESLCVSHTFRCECRLKPLEPGAEMSVDLRLDDGHTVVCGHAVLVETEDGGIKFEVKT
jgi:hypothetical protein